VVGHRMQFHVAALFTYMSRCHLPRRNRPRQ
jgi:hypothetical protein